MEYYNCPRCETKTLEVCKISADITAYECSKCHGFYVTGPSLENIEDHTRFVVYEKKDISKGEMQLQGMFCPRCRKKIMLKKRSAIDRSVLMDVCPECKGVWLDGGELEAIRADNIFDIIRRLLNV